MEKIEDKKYVELVYDLMEKAEPIDIPLYQFTEQEPDRFIFGMDGGAMIQGFKDAIRGLKAGDEFDFTLEPRDAFGAIEEEYIKDYPRDMFEIDGKFDEERIKPGETIEMMTADGQRIPCNIVAVDADKVTLDFNHPLAGQSIRFKGHVKTVRPATEEELNPRHSCCGGCHGGNDDSCGCEGGCGGGCEGGCK